MRRKLKNTNIYLEEMVQKRTSELSEANEELLNLNENLEHLVQERTTKISSQLAKITEYAHINSHEVRGPLARIMGLIKLINATKDIHEIIPLINKLEQSANELDEIVRKMNGLLGSETQIND
jgi:signal transduction histidine kinase